MFPKLLSIFTFVYIHSLVFVCFKQKKKPCDQKNFSLFSFLTNFFFVFCWLFTANHFKKVVWYMFEEVCVCVYANGCLYKIYNLFGKFWKSALQFFSFFQIFLLFSCLKMLTKFSFSFDLVCLFKSLWYRVWVSLRDIVKKDFVVFIWFVKAGCFLLKAK